MSDQTSAVRGLDRATRDRVLKEQMEPLFRAPFRLLGHIFNASFVVLVLWGTVASPLLLGWLAAMCIVTLARIGLCLAYMRRDPPPDEISAWGRYFFIGTLCAGLVWGSSSAIFWLHASHIAHAFVAFVVGGTTAAVAMITYAHLPSLHAFLLFGGMPVAANLMLKGDGINAAMGAMVFLFVVLAMGYARRANRVLTRSLILKEVNQNLVEELSKARDLLEQRVMERTEELNRTNANLMAEMQARKETENQLHQALKMEAVGQLTGGIAHDFNNLLSVIQGNAELLSEKSGLDAKMMAEIAAILRAGERGAELTRQLLAFSRKQELRPRRVKINGLVSSMTGLLERTLGPDIAVKFTPDTTDCIAIVDPGQLENVLLNLAINARDAMPDGGTLDIETATGTYAFQPVIADSGARVGDVPPKGTYILLTVRDNGTGIPEKELQKVWEPFYTTKDAGKGSGLGLSMVYGFMRQSGGHVEIESTLGLGTTVRLYLPVSAPEAEAGSGIDADSNVGADC